MPDSRPELEYLPLRWRHQPPDQLILFILGRPDPDDLPAACDQTRLLVQALAVRHIICDVAAVDRPCAVLLDALARLSLTARASDTTLELRNADRIAGFIRLAGLADVLPKNSGGAGRQPESREQPGHVEEMVDAHDLTIDDLDDL